MGNLSIIENRESVEPKNMGYELLPAGLYDAAVTSSEVVPTSKGDGVMLKVTHTIVEDGYEGRLIFTNFNIKNANEKAQQIGRGMLSSLGRACGLVGIPEDSTELHDKFHVVKVAVREGKGINPKTGEPYGPKNEITAFFTREQAKGKPRTEQKQTVADKEPAMITKREDNDVPDFLK